MFGHFFSFKTSALELVHEFEFTCIIGISHQNRRGTVVFSPAFRPGLQHPAGAFPAGSSLLAALPQHSKDAHMHTFILRWSNLHDTLLLLPVRSSD